MKSLTAVLATATGVLLVAGLVAQGGQRTVRDGVFSRAQVARGERLFESLWETFDYVSSEMPEDDPGSLEPEEYADVLAYLLSAYGLPSGAANLPVDRGSLRTIAIARPKLPGS